MTPASGSSSTLCEAADSATGDEVLLDVGEANRVAERCARQLTKLQVAGFSQDLQNQYIDIYTKVVCPEDLHALFDEYLLEHGKGRSNVVQSLRSCDPISLDTLAIGSPNLLFCMVGESGTGKTCMLIRLNYLLTCHHSQMLQRLYCQDTTWAYFEQYAPSESTRHHHPGRDDRPEDVDAPYAVPSCYSHLIGTNLATKTANARKPQRLVSIYVLASDLLEHSVFVNDQLSVHLEELLKAAYQTYQKFCSQSNPSVSQSVYLSAYRFILLSAPVTSIFLLVDGFDSLHSASRALLLNHLHKSLSRFNSVLFRVFVAGRPFSYFKLFQDMPPSIYFLYLDKLVSHQLKSLFYASFSAPSVASYLDRLPPHAPRARLHQVFLRTCRSPYLVFLLSRVPEASISQKLDSLHLPIYELLETLFDLVVQQTQRRDERDVYHLQAHHLALFDGHASHPPCPDHAQQYVGRVPVTTSEFFELVSLVAFLYSCWTLVPSKCDLVVRDKFQHLIFILLKHHHDTLAQTVLGKLRMHYITTRNTSSPCSVDNSTQNDDAISDLARDIWNSVALKLVHLDLIHLIPRPSKRPLHSFELLFKDEQMLQYLCIRFLLNVPLSTAIFSTVDQALSKMIDFETDFPIFSWKNASWFLTHKKWNKIFDMYISKIGTAQFSSKVLRSDNTIYDWLGAIVKNNGVDAKDMGQIRFHRLLKSFSLEYEEFQLVRDHWYQTKPASHQNLNDDFWKSRDDHLSELGAAFGASFLSILRHDRTTITHIVKPPISSLDCFPPTITSLILEELLFLAFDVRSVVVDLLAQLARQNPEIEQKLLRTILCSAPTHQLTSSTFKLLSVCTQKNYKYSDYFISLFSNNNPQGALISTKFFNKLGLDALELAKRSFLSRDHPQSDQPSTCPPPQCTRINHTHYYDHASFLDQVDAIRSFESTCHQYCTPFLFSDNEWNVIIHATCRYLYHFYSPVRPSSSLLCPPSDPDPDSGHSRPDAKEPDPIRDHMHLLTKLFKHDDPNCRLLPFLLIGSNRPHSHKDNLGPHNARDLLSMQIDLAFNASPTPLFSERPHFSKQLQLILPTLFGSQAAEHCLELSPLFKKQPRLLYALNVWMLSRLSKAHRQSLLRTILNNSHLPLKLAVIELVQRRCDVLAQMEPIDVTNVMHLYVPENVDDVRIYIVSLNFLCHSILNTTSQDYRLHAIDKIVYLLTQYGFQHLWITEPLLRCLDAVLCIDNLSAQERNQLVLLLTRNNIHCKLFQMLHLRPSPHWRLMVLGLSLLRHFVQPDSEEMFEYLRFLSWNVPELRTLVIHQLLTIDDALIPSLISRLENLIANCIIDEKKPFVHTAISTILGQLGVTRGSHTLDTIIQLSVKYVKLFGSPKTQMRGLAILSILSSRARQMTLVQDSLRAALQHQRDMILQENGDTDADAVVLMTAIICTLTDTCQILTDMLPILLCLPKECATPSVQYVLCQAVCGYFKKVVPDLTDDQRSICTNSLRALICRNNPHLVELAIKVIRYLGRSVIKQYIPQLIKAPKNLTPSGVCAVLAALGCFMSAKDDQGKRETLLLLPTVTCALEDRNPMVLKQALKVISQLHAKPKLLLASPSHDPVAPRFPSHNEFGEKKAKSKDRLCSMAFTEVALPEDTEGDREPKGTEDLWYTHKVFLPNYYHLENIVHKKRYRYNHELRLSIFQCIIPVKRFSEIRSLLKFIMCNKNMQNLTDFVEIMSQWRTQALPFIMDVILLADMNSHLLRICANFLNIFGRLIDISAHSWFPLSSAPLIALLRHKDLSVRRAGINLVTRSTQFSHQLLSLVVDIYSIDPNNAIRRQAFQALEDIGRTHQDLIESISEQIRYRNAASSITWGLLSKSWHTLIPASEDPPMQTP